MTRRPVTTFEKPLEIDAPPDMLQKYAQQRSIYQQSVPLAPGRYRLNIVAKDTVAGNLNNYEVALDVPHFDEDKLASSSLILADTIEKLPTKSIGGGMFAIGDTKVRPRLGNKFTKDEKMGIYLQVYNFEPDEKTQKPSGSIEYEIDKAGSNEKVMDFSEEVGSIPNASARSGDHREAAPAQCARAGDLHHQGEGDRQEPEPDRPAAGKFYGKLIEVRFRSRQREDERRQGNTPVVVDTGVRVLLALACFVSLLPRPRRASHSIFR